MTSQAVYVTGLTQEITPPHLATFFQEAGDVIKSFFLKEGNSYTAYVVFRTEAEARKALELDGDDLDLVTLGVKKVSSSQADQLNFLLKDDLGMSVDQKARTINYPRHIVTSTPEGVTDGPNIVEELVDLFQSMHPSARRKALDQLHSSFGVQEVVRTDSTLGVTLRKLRLFSGKKPIPSGEVDYATWRLSARQILSDISIPEVTKKRIILQSLLRPALDAIHSTASALSAEKCFEFLETLYGSVDDGHDLYVKFLNTYQNDRESPSDYIQRLYIRALEVVEKEGFSVRQLPGNLVRQFERGCQDETLLQKLRLDERQVIPDFPELLLAIRKEESRRTEKRLRQKKLAQVNQAVADESLLKQVHDLKAEVAKLKQQTTGYTPSTAEVAQLKQQTSTYTQSPIVRSPIDKNGACRSDVASLGGTSSNMDGPVVQHMIWPENDPPGRGAGSRLTGGPSSEPKVVPGSNHGQSYRTRGTYRKPRNIFCYHCGQDNHLRRECTQERNAELVQEKLLSSVQGLKHRVQGHRPQQSEN